MKILARAITPKRAKLIDTDILRAELSDELEDMKSDMIDDFEKTSQNWEHGVDFKARKVVSSSEVSLIVYPTGEGKDIWGYLNFGTSVRYATMTPNFQAKTRPGRWASGAGRGGVAFISRNRPRPGIQARDWTGKAAEKYKPEFKRVTENALRRTARQ